MRFSLVAIFAFIALWAGAITMYRAYDWYGLVFLLPHLSVTSISYWLFLSRRRVAAGMLIATYFGLWANTAWYDTDRVYQSRVAEKQFVDFNPMDDGNGVEMSWFYVMNISSPCPMVVVFEEGFHTGGSGGGGQSYCLTIFGRSIIFRYVGFWCS